MAKFLLADNSGVDGDKRVRRDGSPAKPSVTSFHQPALGLAESHAAPTKHAVARVEKTMGVVKAYLQFRAVTATKVMARAHAVWHMKGAKVPVGILDSSHANTAANKRNTEKKRPNVLKKSQ